MARGKERDIKYLWLIGLNEQYSPI